MSPGSLLTPAPNSARAPARREREPALCDVEPVITGTLPHRAGRGAAQTGTGLPGCLYGGYYARHDVGNGAVVSVPYALLALLSEGPKFGLQLREEFEARTGEVWPLNVGQVYKTLGRLERDGLAAHTAGPERPAARRAGDEGAGGGAGPRRGRARGHPGAPAVPDGADAAVDPAERRRGPN